MIPKALFVAVSDAADVRSGRDGTALQMCFGIFEHDAGIRLDRVFVFVRAIDA